MNLLELQLLILVSGVPERLTGPTPMDGPRLATPHPIEPSKPLSARPA
jgi:hypothetical protein